MAHYPALPVGAPAMVAGAVARLNVAGYEMVNTQAVLATLGKHTLEVVNYYQDHLLQVRVVGRAGRTRTVLEAQYYPGNPPGWWPVVVSVATMGGPAGAGCAAVAALASATWQPQANYEQWYLGANA